MSDFTQVINIVIVAGLLIALSSLGIGLYYLVIDNGTTRRTLNSLTVRIVSVGFVFFLIMFLTFTGHFSLHNFGS